MSESNPYSKRKPRPYDVEAWVQFKLLRLAAHHPDTKKADLAVFAEIIQRYHGQYGNGFVSDEEICALTGLCDRTVGRSRQRLTHLGFVDVVRAGTRGHATVYRPNFSLVPQKGDSTVTVLKDDIQVHEMDPSVTLSPEYGDTDVTPSYLQDRLTAGLLIDRDGHRPPTASPAAGGLAAPAAGETAVEGLQAFLTAYCPADMSKPARAAIKRAWDALPPDTDRAMVIDAAADWHQAWAQQNDPNAPRMSAVRWLKDEMWLKPAPRGFNKVERRVKTKAKAGVSDQNPKPRKPSRAGGPARITAADVVTAGDVTKLRFTTDKAGEYVIVIEHPDSEKQEAGQRQLAALVAAAGLAQIDDSSELHGRTIVITGDGFEPPEVRPDDDTPLPVKPEPEPMPEPESKPVTESEAAAIKARIDALPPLSPHLNEWQRRKEAQWRAEAGRREWDAAHPELFEDEPAPLPPQPDDWPDWMEDDAA
jgi:hypothetical protein